MKRLIYAGLAATVVSTGGYLVVYLARWEWQRSLMAGELLLVSLLVLLGVAGADRLRRIERRLTELADTRRLPEAWPTTGPYDAGAPGLHSLPGPGDVANPYGTRGSPGSVGVHRTGGSYGSVGAYGAGGSYGSVGVHGAGGLHSGAGRPYGVGGAGDGVGPVGEMAGGARPKFRWLQAEPSSYGVFIPVLLGAGIVVSGLAALVERVSAGLRRRLGWRGPGVVGRGGVLAVPAGGVLAGAPDLAVPGTGAGGGRQRAFRVVLWSVAVAVAAGLGLQELAERTQDRPDAPVQAAVSTVVIEASTHRAGSAPDSADLLANRLWEYCRGSTQPYIREGGLTPLGGQRYALVVQPALGEHALRRFEGCLQDAVIDHGKFRVVSVVPAPED